jgi:hypothetical protein
MRRLLLASAALLGLAAAGALASVKQADLSAAGRITRLGHASITVGPVGQRHLTCATTSYSPSTGPFAPGDQVRIACTNHVLVGIEKTKADASVTSAHGPIADLTATSVAVQTMSCSVGPGSPSTSGFSLGDSVRMSCVNGVLHGLDHR